MRRLGLSLALAVLAGLVLALPAAAADQVTDGDMEVAGIGNWPHTDVTATNSSATTGTIVRPNHSKISPSPSTANTTSSSLLAMSRPATVR